MINNMDHMRMNEPLEDWALILSDFDRDLNICHNFKTIRGRAFIFNNMYIPCDESFPFIPKLLT